MACPRIIKIMTCIDRDSVELLNGRSLSVYSLFVYSLIVKGCHCDPDEVGRSNPLQSGKGFFIPRIGIHNAIPPHVNSIEFFVPLLLTDCGASVPRYESAFHSGMFEVRAKHFRQDTANLISLMLCN